MEKFKKFMLENALFFAAILVAIGYALSSVYKLVPTNKSILNIIQDSGLIVGFGFTVSRVFSFQGIIKGKNTKDVKDIETERDKLIIKTSPISRFCNGFCTDETSYALKQLRTLILRGYDYNNYYDEKGNVKKFSFVEIKKPEKPQKKNEKDIAVLNDKEKETYDATWVQYYKDYKDYKEDLKKQKLEKKAFYKSLNAKVTPLTPQSMVSGENHIKYDPFNFGKSPKKYYTNSSFIDALNKSAFAIVFALYVINNLTEFKIENLLWIILQIALFFALGLLQFFLSWFYMQTSYIASIQKQNQCLNKFINTYCNKDNIDKELIEQIKNQVLDSIEIEQA